MQSKRLENIYATPQSSLPVSQNRLVLEIGDGQVGCFMMMERRFRHFKDEYATSLTESPPNGWITPRRARSSRPKLSSTHPEQENS